MRTAVAFTLALCFVTFAVASAEPSAAPSPTPASSASPSPLDQAMDLDGTSVTIRDFVTLMAGMTLAFTPAGPHPSSDFITKPQSEMPAYDPDWHYVSSETKNGQPVMTIWVSQRLNGKAPRDLMESTVILGLLDAGYGGAVWQKVYAKSLALDQAQGPNAANPIKNRRDLSDRLAGMIDILMDAMKKS